MCGLHRPVASLLQANGNVCDRMHYAAACLFVRLKGAGHSRQIRVDEDSSLESWKNSSDTTGFQIMHDHYPSISMEKHP